MEDRTRADAPQAWSVWLDSLTTAELRASLEQASRFGGAIAELAEEWSGWARSVVAEAERVLASAGLPDPVHEAVAEAVGLTVVLRVASRLADCAGELANGPSAR